MRKLILVPIIHSKADLGSLAPQIKEGTKVVLGDAGWRNYQKTVAQFWGQITKHFEKKKVRGWHIFQDGLMAEGELGRKIIQKGAEAGSPNHQLIIKLLKKGAVLEATEDASLLKDEYRLIERIVKGPFWRRIGWSIWYRVRKGSLLKKRDRFIAERIDKTLWQKDGGVLFIGAYHDVEAYLPKDIRVMRLKDPKMIQSYYKDLVAKRRVASYEWYLEAPIKVEEA